MEFGRFSGRSGAKYGANANYQLGEEERKLLRRAKLGTDEVVGVERIELSTSCSQSRRPTAGLHPDGFLTLRRTYASLDGAEMGRLPWYRNHLGRILLRLILSVNKSRMKT